MSRNLVIKGYGYRRTGDVIRPNVTVTSEVRTDVIDIEILGGVVVEREDILIAQLSPDSPLLED